MPLHPFPVISHWLLRDGVGGRRVGGSNLPAKDASLEKVKVRAATYSVPSSWEAGGRGHQLIKGMPRAATNRQQADWP